MLDVGKAFTYVFGDRAWPSKILLGGLFVILGVFLVGLPVLFGYFRKLFLAVVENPDAPLPEWDVGSDFVEGLPGLCVAAVFGLIGFLLGHVPCLGLVLTLLPMFLLPAALTNLFAKGRLADAFDFPWIFSYIGENLASYTLAVLLWIGISLVSALAGAVLLLVGVFFTSFWASLVSCHAIAQVYRNSKLVTPHPVLVVPEPPAAPLAAPAVPAAP